jgi:hypothetical protein
MHVGEGGVDAAQGGRPVIGEADHYRRAVEIFRARVAELNLTYDSLDHLCNFPARYTATLLSGGKAMSVYSLFTMARALALMPMFGHDEAQLADLHRRADWIESRRKGSKWRPRKISGGATRFTIYSDFYKKIGRKGAVRKHALRKFYRERARKGAAARWGNGYVKHVD